MYDLYDSNKSRYVTHDYRPKGDRFSRGLAARPRIDMTINNYNTGHSAIRRVCTSRTQHLTIGSIKEMFPKEIASKLEHQLIVNATVQRDGVPMPLVQVITRLHGGVQAPQLFCFIRVALET